MNQQRKPDETLLEEARSALEILGAPVRSGPFERVEGIDTVHLGLDAVASALVRIVDFPPQGDEEAPKIDDVLSYLKSRHPPQSDEESVALAKSLIESIKKATYHGLSKTDIEKTENDRHALHDRLTDLVERLTNESGFNG